MWRLATSLARVIGLASLTLLATSVPPSARPAAAPVKYDPASSSSKSGSTTPPQESDKRDRSSDPALVVSVDLGNIWDKAAEVRTNDAAARSPREWKSPDESKGSAPDLCLVPALESVKPTRRDVISAAVPAIAIHTVRMFLTTDRAQAPPCA